ncbi:MAG: ADP-glyceromanno-heptose 6-epimerase [Candidatus Omnitrophica bacterium]|nr:ADP-glyceromanno-heptose 6-epimerase [Candidatus Omnitrophota bacterium]MBU1133466.1 ADP-glyceromanno-heptose 6-epimerase [Candidatus Omnitrophota bacterium]MBU1524249.1 ADP-glyceromanno-heptose 6-epimerase [Candidatus Omnitrophota bacterium]MBU1809568.1 ADP-glyceromanno-heptose 6-epimerase [Candidatus Omnitrophota bacterium]MBU2504763.1 ADP-glyceromanno-heptose 6-epimerase [Candidatus Omnitrophota bacterium]
MKILVTGGAGFVGSNVVKILEDRGAKIFILDDFSGANFKNLDGIKGEVVCGDILEQGFFKKLPKLDGVIHEAAITDTLLTDDKKMVKVNFNGFRNVLFFCLKQNVKLIYASSAGVYGNGIYPARESQRLNPLNVYAYSKYLCDCLAAKFMKRVKSSIVGLRYFNVYGPGEYHKGSAASMIYQLYLQAKEGRSPRVFKYGEQRRDFIYVKDVARITAEALKLKKSAILNVGTGNARSFNEIISILNKNLKKNLKPDYFDNPYRGVYQDYTQADISFLRKLKLTPKFSLEEGIEDYLRFHLQKNL